jgi:tRNA 2-thiocytidine biosynthesis protein TtcA
MLPLQTLFKGKIILIRPLALIEEKKIERFAREMDLPFGPSGCPSSGKTKRREVKELIETLERKNRKVKGNIFRSLSNIKLDYTLLRWKGLTQNMGGEIFNLLREEKFNERGEEEDANG